MKKILALGLILSSINLAAIAQQTPKKESREDRKRTELVNKTAEEIAKKRTDHIDKEVQLTDQQRKQVYALYLKEAKEKIQAEEKASLPGNANTKKVKKNSESEIHKLLTEDQKKVLADKKKQHPNSKEKNGGLKKTTRTNITN